MSTFTPDNVWLAFDPNDDEEATHEANIYAEGDYFRVDWSNTAVGLITSRWFDDLADAEEWLTRNGYLDFSS